MALSQLEIEKAALRFFEESDIEMNAWSTPTFVAGVRFAESKRNHIEESEIQKGTILTCVEIWKQAGGNLTLDKDYEVTKVEAYDRNRSRFTIIGDNGTKRRYFTDNPQFKIKQP